MYLSPRRWQPLTWIIVSMWMLANPALTWMIYHYLERYYPAGPAFPGSFTTAVLIQLAAFIAAVWWASRSLRLSSAVLAIGVVAAIVDWQASQLPAWPEALYFVTPIVWQVANAGLLINWAVSERRRARRETGVCASCGYDLRGLAVGSGGLVCPECGGKPTAVGGHDA